MKRIVHISVAHTPTDVRIFEKECKSLAEAGYEVHYLVPKTARTKKEGVYLHNLPKRDRKFRILRVLERLYDTYRSGIQLHGNLYHLHDPELIPVGLLLKLKGKTVIYDAHEDAPIEAISLNKQSKLNGLLLSFTWRLYLAIAKIAFDGFIAATPAIAETLPKKKSTVVRNYPRLEPFMNVIQKAELKENVTKLIYIGTISEIRGIKQMLDAIDLIPSTVNFKLQIIGDFTSISLKNSTMKHPAWQKVEYLPYQPWTQVIEKLSTATVGLVLLHPTPEYQVSLPVKLFEYMASGIPVVASDFPLWRSIIEPAQCGLLVDPLNPHQIAKALTSLLSQPELCKRMGTTGKNAVYEQYSWQSEKQNLITFYQRFAA